MTSADSQKGIIECVSQIAAAYIAKNPIDLNQLPAVLLKIRNSLMHIPQDSAQQGMPTTREPAVPIEQSVCDNYIVCLEDGKQLQMLKRHLKAVYGLTVAQYKSRWNLPATYPIVAPNYAKRRQEIAKSIGLGRDKKKKNLKVRQGNDTPDGQEQIAILKI